MCDLFDCHDCIHECKYNATDRDVERLWDELEDVPIDENECLDIDWQGWYKGTHREVIWHWFDEHHSKGVGWLMNEYERQTMTLKAANNIYQTKRDIYDELTRLLTEYEWPDDSEDYIERDWEAELYEMLVKIQNRWEDTITADEN